MIHTMSQTSGVPMLGLHGLPQLKCMDTDIRNETNDNAVYGALGLEGNIASSESTPRKSSRQQTPRTPVAMNQTPLMSISSPLRMVGKASPCSVKLKGSSRLEGGFVVSNIQQKHPHDPCYPRELSFGNLLDNDSTDGRASGSNHFPRPIGLPKKVDDASCMHPLSPRKRSRKAAPVRSSVNAL